MIEKKIGKRIQELRRKKKITQAELAEKLDISTNHLSALERGQYNIKLEILVLIMNELECSADEIFCDVIKTGYKIKSSKLTQRIEMLSVHEQNRLFEIIDAFIKTAKQ